MDLVEVGTEVITQSLPMAKAMAQSLGSERALKILELIEYLLPFVGEVL